MEDPSPFLPNLHLLRQAFTANINGIVIADARHPDLPLIYVNPAFERLSGYPAAEIIGRNCRFLQGEDRDQDARQPIRAALTQGQSVTAVLRNFRKDGTMFYNELTLSPIRDEAGEVTHFMGFQSDVTAREEALRSGARAGQHLASTLERITDGFVSFDQDWNVTYLNAAAAELAAREPSDVHGQNLFVRSALSNQLPIGQAIQRARDTGLVQHELNASVMGRQTDITVYPGEDGVSLFIRDVTESRQAQRELQVSEERFFKVFQTSPISIFVTRQQDGRFVDVNEEFLRLSGYTREEIIGHSSQELSFLSDPADRTAARDMRDTLQPGQSREVLIHNDKGEELHGVLSIVQMEVAGEACTTGFLRDVTEEKRAQRRLEDSEQHSRIIAAELQRTLDLSLDLIVSTAADGHFITVSAASSHLLGYLPEEMIGRSAFDFIHPDDADASLVDIRRVRAGQATTLKNRYLHKDGRVVWLEWSAVIMPGEEVTYGVGRDITQGQAAVEDQSFLAAIVQVSHNAIIGLSLDDTIRSWNPGAEELYGYTAAEAIGQPVTFLVPVEAQAFEQEVLARAKQGQRDLPFEGQQVTRGGQRLQVMVAISPILDAAGQVIGVSKITRDITALRQAEQEVQALNEGLREQLTHVTGLREVDQSIAASADLDVSLGLLLDNIRVQLKADAVTVLLLNQTALTLEYAVERGFTTALRGLEVRLGEDLGGQVALNRQPILIPDLRSVDLSPTWRAMLERERIMAYYGAPIIAKGKVLGVIEVLHRKPFEPSATWLETFDVFNDQASIAVDSSWLFTELERRNLELRLAYDETIEGWARALDLRDKETEGHSRRVTELTVLLCRRLGLPPEQLVQVRRGALLHDIGKMGIPDAVLLKPGALTGDEWVRMKKHPGYAVDLLSPIEYLRPALDIPQYHHEKWDGSGYPLGLKGEAIPMTARAFAVVDVYDALTSDRPYRSAWTPEQAVDHIRSGAGTHFDPDMVEVFVHLLQPESHVLSS